AHFARTLVSAESARKIIQGNEADGHGVKLNGEAFGVTKRQNRFEGTSVACETLFKAILTVINIRNVDFEVAEALLVAQTFEDFPGGLCGVEGAVILSEQNERLNGRNQRACFFLCVADLLEYFERLGVEVQCLLVVANHVERVCLGTQTTAERFTIAQLARDGYGRFGER